MDLKTWKSRDAVDAQSLKEALTAPYDAIRNMSRFRQAGMNDFATLFGPKMAVVDFKESGFVQHGGWTRHKVETGDNPNGTAFRVPTTGTYYIFSEIFLRADSDTNAGRHWWMYIEKRTSPGDEDSSVHLTSGIVQSEVKKYHMSNSANCIAFLEEGDYICAAIYSGYAWQNPIQDRDIASRMGAYLIAPGEASDGNEF
ncbi:hypothetical protein MOV08_05285 [Streptomyces yunnanensis]|uniref:Uncharacterized protein n=1 Tax=Streptomyces yunnanensis TaxID=156453 RepID=A0ABY8A3H8_9ACTN|nr:hypothetical protein [Streptomyces yunnanensis]WEB38774.1 hypothetical protein MOV08_05285 [Streptomyces yunnanensis]